MDSLPDALLVKILSYLPSHSFLPTAHVSQRFHAAWLDRMIPWESRVKTNPLQVGNLFQAHWNKPSVLGTSLLEYYLSCGWIDPKLMQCVLKQSAARGDIVGMKFLVSRELCRLDDADICTVAGAAGHLSALQWLREEKECPWSPCEIWREASENNESAVVEYVELNSAGYEITAPCYGDGLPWS